MLNGKKMVLDRGRYKEAGNVGSRSSQKAYIPPAKPNLPKGVKMGTREGFEAAVLDKSRPMYHGNKGVKGKQVSAAEREALIKRVEGEIAKRKNATAQAKARERVKGETQVTKEAYAKKGRDLKYQARREMAKAHLAKGAYDVAKGAATLGVVKATKPSMAAAFKKGAKAGKTVAMGVAGAKAASSFAKELKRRTYGR